MDAPRFDRLTARIHQVTASVSRRRLVQGLALSAVTGGGLLCGEVAAAKKELCQKDGSACREAGRECKASFCLTKRFTVEASWTNAVNDHDTYLFVPKRKGGTEPSPYISYSCNPDQQCASFYPFACVDQDATGPGNEVTTVHKMLDGTYEYWISINAQTPAKEVTIKLRRRDGSLVRSWQSPANPATSDRGWHVCDVNGKTGRVKSVDRKINATMPEGAHDPNTDVCPPI